MMKQKLSPFLFITHETSRYSYLDSVQMAIAGGCKFIQLRMKEASKAEIRKVAQQALKHCQAAGVHLFVDDEVELCLELGLDGVHLGKHDMPVSQARQILGPETRIGGTANSFDDIQRLQQEGADYIGLGPYRYTTTKKNLSPILGLKGYQEILTACRQAEIHLPIYAIGGIGLADIPPILQTGVWGIALSSSILRSTDPIEQTKKSIHCIDTYHEKINYSK